MSRKRLFVLPLIAASLGLLSGCAVVAVGTIAGTAMMANDRRPVEIQIADEAIELKASSRLADDSEIAERGRVVAVSYNQQVVLVGQLPSEDLRARATRIVRNIPSVRAVQNQIRIGQPISAASQTHDAYITSKIKSKMALDEHMDASRIKVVTENGEVFLLGLVSRDEGQKAIEIARNTAGVTKIVDLFQYM
jgi:osmotically-inducible protein OsmY